MPYTQGASNATGPYTLGGTQTYQQANNGEYQYQEATLSLEQDLFSAFVLSGLVATKDGTTASQLDVTSGVAFPLQTDGTLRRRAPTSSTQSCSGHPSTTLYLDLNPDGTWSWGTTHSGVSGYLPIAQVTTDASANILTVTDERTLNTTLLSGAAGVVSIASAQYVNKTGDTMTGALTAPAFHGPADSATTAQLVDSTHAGSTSTPQVKTTSGGGLSTQETTVGGVRHVALVPTENDGVARGLSLGYVDSGGVYHETISVDSNAGLKFIQTGARYSPVAFFNGTGTGTFNHGLGATPSWVGITCNQSGSSMTVGVDSMGSTTVHVVTGGNLSWMGVAMN